jgi:hypothetical protein
MATDANMMDPNMMAMGGDPMMGMAPPGGPMGGPVGPAQVPVPENAGLGTPINPGLPI